MLGRAVATIVLSIAAMKVAIRQAARTNDRLDRSCCEEPVDATSGGSDRVLIVFGGGRVRLEAWPTSFIVSAAQPEAASQALNSRCRYLCATYSMRLRSPI